MLVLLFICGCCLGSFYCLAAERLPVGKSILFPGSHCPYCDRALAFYEMIPLLSIIIQKFQCRSCARQLPIIYFVSELVSGLLFTYCFAQRPYPASLYTFLFLSMGLLLALTDIFYMLVEPKILFFFFALLLFWHWSFSIPLYLGTALTLFFSLYLLQSIYPQALGGGDILLLAFWSLFTGWKTILFIVFIASSSALVYALLTEKFFHKERQALPFVPFLFIGLLVWFEFPPCF